MYLVTITLVNQAFNTTAIYFPELRKCRNVRATTIAGFACPSYGHIWFHYLFILLAGKVLALNFVQIFQNVDVH